MNRRDDGQSTVEFAFALLLLATFGILGINSIVVVEHQIDVISLAREAALAAARSTQPISTAEDVVRMHGDDDVSVTVDSPTITVNVRRSVSTTLRIIGIDMVEASVTMPLEPP